MGEREPVESPLRQHGNNKFEYPNAIMMAAGIGTILI
jgi:hypothetical protein